LGFVSHILFRNSLDRSSYFVISNMVLQKRYTLPTFSLIAYFLASPQGKGQLQTYFAPVLSSAGVNPDFSYKYKESPLSDWPWPITLCFGYLISVFLLSQYMQNRKAWDLKYFRIFHNAFLCFGSFIMVIGMITELVRSFSKGGIESLICDSNRVQLQGNIYAWYYVFFLSKFYEFIDTYILILRKKPVTFLHCFHHFITAFLCWLGLYDEMAIQWTVIAMNGTVHVFMYYYYLAVSFNSDVWWKKYLTTMQIVQFCLDLVMTLPFFYHELVLGRDCSGTVGILGFSQLVLVSFLVLFINFFRSTYTPKDASKVKHDKAN